VISAQTTESGISFQMTSEQRAIVEMAQGLAKKHQPDPYVSWEEAGSFPWEFMRELSKHGLTGIDIPAEKGGQGLTLLDALLVIAAVAQVAPHMADAVQVTNFGAIRQIAAFGGDRVVEEVLKPILAGEAIATIAMSEPGGGSALSTLRTRAVRDGEEVVLNGSKVFNSSGPHASYYVAWARFGEEREAVGAIVVPDTAPGFERGATERFISGEVHCTLSFDDCRVPAEYVLVDHDGMRKMMAIFNIERLGNATRSYAYGELALRLATQYMLDRETGTGRLADHQGLQWKLADLRMKLDAAQLLLYRAAVELRDGRPDPLYTSIAKCVANEAGHEACHQALQIFGGYGFSSDSPLDYLWKRTRGWMIAGGSTEIQRNRIAREVLKRHRAA
jgi:alkylation response protein AidB-like acyl-CoA dehydrogenase